MAGGQKELEDVPGSTSGEGAEQEAVDPSRLIRTLAMIYAWICMGLFSEIVGPTLPWLKARNDVNYEEISRALMASGFGVLVGAALGGVLCERLLRFVDLWLSACMLVGAMAACVAPWCQNLVLLSLVLSFDGVAKGAMATGTNAFVMKLWGDKAAVPNHSLHFSFGIGALMAPQIARPFLGTLPRSVNGTVKDDELVREYLLGLHMEIPYSIIGGLTLLSALLFAWLYLFRTPLNYPKKSVKEIVSITTSFNGSKTSGIALFLLLMVFFALAAGSERMYGKFIYVFSTEGANAFSTGKGTIVETVFWASFTFGRGLGTLLAKWVPPFVLLCGELLINLGSSFLLLSGANGNAAILWAGTILFGASLSPLIPACLSWINLHIELTAVAMSMVYISIGISGMVFLWLMGFLFETYGPPALMPMECGCTVAIVLVSLVLFVMVTMKDRRKRANSAVPYDHL